jgi:hypothetical protein
MTSRDFDPFGEHASLRFEHKQRLLGANIRFRSNSRALLKLVEHAYAGLPPQGITSAAPELRVTLLLNKRPSRGARRGEPQPLQLLHGAGLLAASTSASDSALLAPREGAALVVVSEDMLRFPYHARYELIEFAVFTLAARSQALVPLHAACVGIGGRGVLLMGDTGAGKSTLALQCLLQGFDFLSEDSVFVQAETLRATGVASFLHVQSESLRWVASARIAAAIRRSPVIRRRSGARKFELDLRRTPFKLASAPLKICAVVFLSAKRARAGAELLRPIPKREMLVRLGALQSYGSSASQWRTFASNAARLAVFELRRGTHPAEGATALGELLARR